jgi:hypothetical protein
LESQFGNTLKEDVMIAMQKALTPCSSNVGLTRTGKCWNLLQILVLACLSHYHIAAADDVYLRNGFVYRNVEVKDTAKGMIIIVAKTQEWFIDTARVLKIQLLELRPGEVVVYELFSEELQEEHKAFMNEKAKLELGRKALLEFERLEAGALVSLYRNDGRVVEGELLAVGDTSLIVWWGPEEIQPAPEQLGRYSTMFLRQEIAYIVVSSKDNFGKGLLFGLLGGAALGVLSYLQPCECTGFVCLCGLGLIVLPPIGVFVGGIVGLITSRPEKTITFAEQQDWLSLRQYARLRDANPFVLLKLKEE